MSIIGRLFYYGYYKPKAKWVYIKKYGGFLNIIFIEIYRMRMEKSARRLRQKIMPTGNLELYFLTGKRFWSLTAFCAYSLMKFTGENIRPVFVDDGSFDDKLIDQINIQFPGCRIRTRRIIENDLQKYLPKSKFPTLNRKREIYPHIRKLTDIHIGSTGWKMVLDSDMLFFKHPSEIVKWLRNPKKSFYLRDPENSYHYSAELMKELCGHEVESNLNVGAVGMSSENIHWQKLEKWVTVLEEKEGTSYLLEQALSAMISAGQEITIAQKEAYIVMPNELEVREPAGVLHHYVAESKQWYYKYGWKQII